MPVVLFFIHFGKLFLEMSFCQVHCVLVQFREARVLPVYDIRDRFKFIFKVIFFTLALNWMIVNIEFTNNNNHSIV